MPRREGATAPSCCATLCHAETEISPLTKPASFLATAEKKRERCLATIPLGSRGGSEDTTLNMGVQISFDQKIIFNVLVILEVYQIPR